MKVNHALTGRQRLIMVANYAAFYFGNFIAFLNTLEAMLAKHGFVVSYVFPKNAPFANWGRTAGIWSITMFTRQISHQRYSRRS